MSLGIFDFNFRRIVRLLVYFLVSRWFIFDVKLRRSFWFEIQDLRFRRNAMVNLVHDRAAEFEAFQVGRFAISVSARENELPVGQACKDKVRADELLLRQFSDLIMAVFEDHEYFIELRAFDMKFLAGDFVADVAGLAVVGDFERLERNFFGIHFVVAAGFGQARIERGVFREQRFQVSNDVLGEILEVFTSLAEVAFGLFNFLTILVDIKE